MVLRRHYKWDMIDVTYEYLYKTTTGSKRYDGKQLLEAPDSDDLPKEVSVGTLSEETDALDLGSTIFPSKSKFPDLGGGVKILEHFIPDITLFSYLLIRFASQDAALVSVSMHHAPLDEALHRVTTFDYCCVNNLLIQPFASSSGAR